MSIEETIHDFGEIDKYSCNIIRKRTLTIFNEEYETNDDDDDEIGNREGENQMQIDHDVINNDNENEDESQMLIDDNNEDRNANQIRGRSRGRGTRNVRGRGEGRSRGRRNNNVQAINLPPAPTFNKFVHQNSLHESRALLPSEINITPYALFSLFFTVDILNTIIYNTNLYADEKGAGAGRSWNTFELSDFKIWLGIVIYSGVFKLPSIRDYWKSSDKYPSHKITDYMSLTKFEQIKRFFHISNPLEVISEDTLWYHKIEPLASCILDSCMKYYLPSSNLSVDEMIIRFSGRSPHTVRMKNKPTPEGYKVFALCDAGYTYNFMFTSRIKKKESVQNIPGINQTGCEVYHLIKELPTDKSFNIYMDNYFSSIGLFNFLREKKIGACGTVRTNSSKFPKVLKTDKKLEWDTLSGVVVDDVLSILWMDNGPVTMLSTIHEITGPENRIDKERRRPRVTSTNATKVRQVFGDAVKKILPIPKIIDDYNNYMGGVDVADQLRGYYATQLTARRTWVPMFFWLLDTVIVNCYLIYKNCNGNLDHKDFRVNLAWDLINSGWDEKDGADVRGSRNLSRSPSGSPSRSNSRSNSRSTSKNNSIRTIYVRSNSSLPIERLEPGAHIPRFGDNRSCVWCRYKKKKEGESSTIKTKSVFYCSLCKVSLCIKNDKNCFEDFHTLEEI